MSFRLCEMYDFFMFNGINNEIWAFLERNTKRNLVHFKRNTGQGQICPQPSRSERYLVLQYKKEFGF